MAQVHPSSERWVKPVGWDSMMFLYVPGAVSHKSCHGGVVSLRRPRPPTSSACTAQTMLNPVVIRVPNCKLSFPSGRWGLRAIIRTRTCSIEALE